MSLIGEPTRQGGKTITKELTLRMGTLEGGVRNDIRPEFIGQNQIAEGLNVWADDPTLPVQRDGFTTQRVSSTGLPSTTLRASALADFNSTLTSRLLVAAFPTTSGGIFYTTAPSNLSGWGSAMVVDAPGGPIDPRILDVGTDQATMVQGNKLLWIFGANSVNIHVMRLTGSLIDCGSSATSPPQNAVDGTYLLERMWMLAGDRLYWSKFLPSEGDLTPDPDAFDTTNTTNNGGGFLTLSPERSDEPVACVGWREESVICLFRGHIEEVVVNSINPLFSIRNVLSSTIGCGARDSVAVVGDDVFFMDQYGNYRSIRRDKGDSIKGMVALPVSQAFRREVPGLQGQATDLNASLNIAQLRKTQVVVHDEYLYLLYARGQSDDPNAFMVLHLSSGRVDGPWVMDRPMSTLAESCIENGIDFIYGMDGDSNDPRSKLYKLFDKSFSDDGKDIKFQMTSSIWDGNRREVDKLVLWADMEFDGAIGRESFLSLRASVNDDFSTVMAETVQAKGTTDYPLLPADYPLTPASYPLTDTTAKLTTKKERLVPEGDGDLPIEQQELPVEIDNLPVEGLLAGVKRGRMIQYQIESTGTGRFQFHGLRIVARFEPGQNRWEEP